MQGIPVQPETMTGISENSRTIASRLTDELTEAIVRGEIPAGKKISEPDLAKKYAVSRGPLREALRRLEGRGLVRHIPHVGARVVALALEEITQLYLVREALEGMAARLAAQHMPKKEVEAVRTLLDEHEIVVTRSDGRRYFQQEGDLDFHIRIVHASENKKLISLLGSELYHLVRMYRFPLIQTPSQPQRALAEHRLVLDAISAGDGELAEILMRRHVSDALKSITNQLGREGKLDSTDV